MLHGTFRSTGMPPVIPSDGLPMLLQTLLVVC